MNSVIGILVFLFFGAVVFLFFFVAIKALFDADSTQIKDGKKDEEVIKEGVKIKNKKAKKISNKISIIITSVVGGLILAASISLIIIKSVSNPLAVFDSVPVAIVSGSMQAKDDKNAYLKENNLDNQFSTGSIIILHKMPEQKDLKRYDVVAYKNKEGTTVVHRIIGFGYYDTNSIFVNTDDISKATEFVFRGDNNTANDTNYVKYSDMIGIYRGEKCPFLGYIVDFAQSYFGFITFAAVIGMLEAYEVFDNKNKKALMDRYEVISGSYDIDYIETNDNDGVRIKVLDDKNQGNKKENKKSK